MKTSSFALLTRSFKQISCLFFLLIVCISFSNASDVDTTKAKLIGKNFITPRIKEVSKLKSTASLNVQMKHAITMFSDGKPLYYIFNFVGRTGFIIISADDDVQPILGYSFESNFSTKDRKPDAFQTMLTNFTDQISYYKKNLSKPAVEIKQLWNQYSGAVSNLKSTPVVASTMQSYTLPASVAPLLATKWNQGCGWNALCPVDAAGQCSHTWAGCVAVSEAQVMKFWNYPTNGEGSKTYTHYKYGTQTADFGAATYNWAGMPNTSSNTEIAKFLYHVGVSVNMDYGTSGSGAYMEATVTSLINYFKYSSNLISTYKSGYSDLSWENLIKRELYEGRPIPYSGGTHAFVLDGYQSGNYFHVNWGWGGSYDGYFYLNNLKPASYDFTSSNCAIIGVMPKGLYTGIDMASVKALTCGVAFNDSTNNGENRINKYNLGYYQATGKEKFYSITTTLSGRLKARITGLGGKKLNLFMLKYPSKDSTIAYGDSTVYIDKAKPGTYYIAVDGLYGDEGKYSVKVTCPTSDPDLTVMKTEISPYYIQPYHSNVNLKCWIKNIGNATAAASKLKFYYSEDQVLNAADIKIDSVMVSSINAGDSVCITKSVSMPAVTSGTRYILFVADYNNVVPETDEEDNIAVASFQGVPAGIMNCSIAVSLKSKVWYNGNTATKGDSIINNYLYYKDLSGREVIHTFTAPYNGMATIDFSEKIMGDLTCLILTGCNENLVDRTLKIYNKNDTIGSLTYVVKKNTTYFVVVDGENRLAGPYSLRINLPDSCPAPTIITYSDTNRCVGSGSAYINATYGYSSYQWYKNGFPILNSTLSNYVATEDGSYSVQVSENGCASNSNKITIKYSTAPSGALIAASGDTTFCKGGDVALNITSAGGYNYQWTRDNVKVSGAISTSYSAKLSGVYRAVVTNQSCTIKSNSVTVTAKSIAADIGDTLFVSTSKLVTYYPFTGANDYLDLSGYSNYNSNNGVYATYDKLNQYNHACYFDGLKSYMTTSNKFNHPDTITLSLWFKTNTNKGGKLIGLGNQQYNGLSTLYDRHIYMDNAGKIYFGIGTATKTVISSSLTYNDDKWHLVTATLSDKGMKLYVDTVLVDSKSTPTNGGSFLGYWRLGCDNLTGWPNKPDSAHFKGIIDEVRIYTRELAAIEVGLLFSTKLLSVKATPDAICQAKGKSKIYINNSELSTIYQLRKNFDNSNLGSAMVGTGGTIFMETDSMTATTALNIIAKYPQTGCEHQLDSVLTITVSSPVTPTISLSSNPSGNEICKGSTLTITSSITNGGTAPSYQWQLNKALAGNATSFSSASLINGDKITMVLTSNAKCLTKSNAYSDTITVKVTEVAKPNISLKSADSLQASVTADSYEWYKNEVSLGVSTRTIKPSSSGTYKVVAVQKTCKSVTSDGLSFTITGINQPISSPEISVFPNPNEGIFRIELTRIEGDFTIEILNTDGKTILQDMVKEQGNISKQIDLTGNPKGVYLLKLTGKQFVKTEKIILR